jgi:Uma2 family endonuclease
MTASASTGIQTISPTTFPQWKPATWEEYLTWRDNPTPERVRLFFNQGQLLIDMGSEGINHASVSDLFTLLLGFWFSQYREQTAASFGRCLIEKPKTQAAAPDLVLYIGEGVPQWQSGEPRRIDLTQWRVPDLVGEVSDTTLATDLDEKKQLYAALLIPEYWVINVQGRQVLAFRLQENGKYQQITHSVALENLPVALLEQTLEHLSEGTNISAALWFAQQIAQLD